MSFTDVVFEVRDPRDPLCKATEDHTRTYAVVRVVEPGHGSHGHRALVSYCGGSACTAQLLRDLNASRAHDDIELLSLTPETATLRATLAPGEPGAGCLLPVGRWLESFGQDAIVEPVLVRAGRARVRLLVPRGLDEQRAILALRELQRAGGWPEFRVVRVSRLEASQYVDSMRRVLTPDQEDILRRAVALGYYDVPKRATLETIAKTMGLSVSPVHKRLKAIESTLVTAYVDPQRVERPDFRRRPRKGTARPAPSPLVDVALRVQAPHAPLQAFVARTPGARVLLHHLGHERARQEATSLLVVQAPHDAAAKLSSELEGSPSVLSVEAVTHDRGHASLRVRVSMSGEGLPPSHPYAWLSGAFHPDVLLKPVLLDGSATYVRFLLLRPHGHDELVERVDLMSKLGGWDAHEIVAVRPFASESASAPLPPPERLTARQDEVLKIAYALGYYRTPRTCTLESVANTLGVSANAIHKNLVAAEMHVISSYLSAGF